MHGRKGGQEVYSGETIITFAGRISNGVIKNEKQNKTQQQQNNILLILTAMKL